jgi:hypothetical protein
VKRIVSISLGSAKRDHAVAVELLGEEVKVERVGTDGSLERAIELVRRLDGTVDAFGMGGIDLYVYSGRRRYEFRDARRIAAAAVRTPIVDGSGLKNTLERRVVRYLDGNLMRLDGKRVLMVASVDRFGMAEALVEAGAEVVFGDLMFGLGIPLPLRRLRSMQRVSRLVLPIVTRLPFHWLYPTGEKQEHRQVRYEAYYQWADVIAGDFLYIKRHMPSALPKKTIMTNTVTSSDVDELRACGVSTLVTTTPNFGGRSFGTNLVEGLIVAMAKKRPEQLTSKDYEEWLDRLDFRPRVEKLDAAPGR